MVTLRPLLLGALALLVSSPPALAQHHFRLVAPTLVAGGRSYEVVGAPLEQASFGYVVLTVPGLGRYVVSDRPFEGARRAGQFDRETLAFTFEGQSVRLRADAPLLSSEAPVYAFVRHTPSGDTRRDGPASVSLRLSEGGAPVEAVAGPTPPSATRAAALGTETEGLVARRREQARMEGEVTRAREERARLAAEVAGMEAEIARLEREAQPLAAQRANLQAELAHLQAGRGDAYATQQNLDARRARLDAERAALERDLDAYAERSRRYEAEHARLLAERNRLSSGLAGSRRERQALEADLRALEAERAHLLAERERLDLGRQRFDTEARALETAVGSLATETTRLSGERDRLADEHTRLVHERDGLVSEQQRLLREVEDLRRATGALSDETARLGGERTRLRASANRTGTGADADELNRAPQQDALALERDEMRREAEGLRRELARLESEVARLRQAPAPSGAAPSAPARLHSRLEAAEAERDEVAVTNAALRRERDGLADQLRDLEAQRDDLARTRAQMEQDRAQLAAERDALHREAEALREELLRHEGALPARPAPPETAARAAAPARPSAPRAWGSTDGPSISLPAFDWSRLQNADEVSAMLRGLEYPPEALMARTSGDVLVLLATDDTGRVVEAAVAEPLGSGLDALAERLVRAMRFVPPVVDGQPAVLRAQVVVRFNA